MNFDYAKWHGWLREKSESLRREGATAKFASREEYGRAMWFDLEGNFALASFRAWEWGGVVDYEIMRLSNKEFVANEAMIKVDDGNFESVFVEFLAIYLGIKS